jgi:IclR family KDG regulon transcriptional repressor
LQLLLDCPSLSIQEIIQKLEFNQSTGYRLVSTLEQNQFIAKNKSNQYEISEALIQKILQKRQHPNMEVTWKSVSFMEQLSKETGETTYIGMLQGTEMMIIQAVPGRFATRTHLETGDRLPLHADAIGKCLLAFQEEEETLRIASSLTFEKRTDYTITSLDMFLEELRQIRDNGYSIDNEEGELGVRCVGAPICKGDQVIAALAISGPSVRVSKEKDKTHIDLVKACAKAISASLD